MKRPLRRLIASCYDGCRHACRFALSLITAVTARIDYQIARLRSPWQITLRWPDDAPALAGRVAIFAHYDRRHRVGAYVLAHLSGLGAAGYQVVFVSNCGRLTGRSMTALQRHCAAIVVRRNLGGKWGAWRAGLRLLGDTPLAAPLLLLDDSNYGPFSPLAPLVDSLDFSQADIWGLTDSWHIRWHLACYFLAIHPRVLQLQEWHKFWAGMVPAHSQRWLISRGEVGFSQSLMRTGLRLQPRWSFRELYQGIDQLAPEPLPVPVDQSPAPYDNIAAADEFDDLDFDDPTRPAGARATLADSSKAMQAAIEARMLRSNQRKQIDHLIASARPFDLIHVMWRQLLDHGYPYLNRDLLRRNPWKVADMIHWRGELNPVAPWAQKVIDSDLPRPRRWKRARRRNRLWPKILAGIEAAASFVFKANRFLLRRTGEELSELASRLRSHRQARFCWPESPVECGPRIVVFVHFDRYGEVRPYVLHYLDALRDAGVSILFVSNSRRLRPRAIELLKPRCMGIIVRANVGYDFGAWREALEYLRGSLDRLEWLAIANDSLYGPLAPLGPLLARMDFTEADIWGLTDSNQRNWHLQSYFIAFSRRVLRSRAWREFWSGVRPVKSKSWAISHGELKFTGYMQQAGFECAALFPYHNLIARVERKGHISNRPPSPLFRLEMRQRRNLASAIKMGYALNPTAELWRQLLRAGFPFVKRELLRSNPTEVPDTIDWRSEVAATSGADVRLIEEDLRRSVRGRVA